MTEYKGRRARKRAAGGMAGGEGKAPPHAGHMIIMIGLGAKKPKKKAGGKVEGAAAKHHLGKRARGGMTSDDGGAAKWADGSRIKPGTGEKPPRALDAREDSNDEAQDGRDKVSQRSGTEERAVEMGDARKRGGGIHIKKSHEGRLHEDLGVAAGKPIPMAKLEKAKESAGSAERKRITFAENARHWKH